MNRLLALLLPLVALISGAADLTQPRVGQSPSAVSQDLAAQWKASVEAENGKNYDEALSQLRQYLANGGDKFMATLRAGWLMYLKGDYPGATLNYSNASHMQPTALTPLLGLLYTSVAMNDRPKIIQAAENVLRIEPTNYKAQVAIAEAYYAAGDYRHSHSFYRRVLTNYPDDLYATNGVAWSALLIGDKAESATEFKKLLSVSPDYPSAADGLARATGKTATPGLANPMMAHIAP